jgi:hypothetical protein
MLLKYLPIDPKIALEGILIARIGIKIALEGILIPCNAILIPAQCLQDLSKNVTKSFDFALNGFLNFRNPPNSQRIH